MTADSIQPSPEAVELFEQAIEEWDNTEESKQDERLRRDVASLLSTAIQKAKAPYPRARSLLAIFLCDLGQEREALQEANQALTEDPDEFRAQLVKVDVAWKGAKIKKLGVGDFLQRESSMEGSVVSSVLKGTVSVIVAAGALATQNALKIELDALIQIFRRVCKSNSDADEFAFMSQRIIDIGDSLLKVPMDGKPDLYAEVANAPINQLQFSNDQQAAFVRKLIAIANGRANILRQTNSGRSETLAKFKNLVSWKR